MKPQELPGNYPATALLKGGAAFGAIGAALSSAGVAEARTQGQKEQVEALKAAAAARAALSQPATELAGDNYARGKLLLGSNDIPGAMAEFRRVLVDEPRSVDAMNGLAVTYDRMGRYDVARGWYEAALAVDPNDAAVQANLGYSLTLQGAWREAIPFLQAAAASRDPAAAATARRLLNRADAALTAERAISPVLERPAELALVIEKPVPTMVAGQPRVAAPVLMAAAEPSVSKSARIEVAANGEAQLVLGAAHSPAPELVASLGDAAELVLLPRAMARVVPSSGVQPIVIARNELEQQAMVASLVQPSGVVVTEGPLDVGHRDIRPDVLIAAAQITLPVPLPVTLPDQLAEIARSDLGTEPESTVGTFHDHVVELASFTSVRSLAALSPVVQSEAEAPFQGVDAQPRQTAEWLVHVRNAVLNAGALPAEPLLVLAPLDCTVPRLYESDDADLNRFAARLRPAPDQQSPDRPTPIERQVAIARLEALIARVRRA